MSSTGHPTPSRNLKDSIQFVKGVGPKRAVVLKRLGLETAGDCLNFLPHRYEDRSRVKNLGQLVPGEEITCVGSVLNAGTFRLGRRKKVFEVIFKDDSGTLRARWYRFNETYMTKKFQTGKMFILSGKPAVNRLGSGLEMSHPDVDPYDHSESETPDLGRIVPVYHTTEGLHQKSIRAIQKFVVDHYADLMEEWIPDEIIQKHSLCPRPQAFRESHFPENEISGSLLESFRTPAQIRLIFEELFLIQLGLAYKRKHSEVVDRGPPLKTRGETIRKMLHLLKFELTGAQKNVLRQIMNSLEQTHPMNRLLHGDVGSGKTIVALITLLTAVDNGCQGALMAPTELLAEQHYLNLKPYCSALNVRLELITSATPPKDKERIRESIRTGETQITIGTHALIQKDVLFHKLVVVVIDEQHRFGVLQRDAIGKKGEHPHVLIMTATPIPRSLALTLYGDMDVSILDEMPPGRKPIVTRRYYEKKRDEAYAFVKRDLEEGRQAYVVCPLIEESDSLELKTALEVFEDLKNRFPEFKVGLIHGRLKKEERQQIMASFKEGDLQILVATTVIEVGIDVPNATLILIEHAERFGLAQLHQLRGRVGRGEHPSHCLLLAYYPLSDDAQARLEAMVDSSDGFFIAERDLKIRGPGDFMGTRQSGLPTLRFADLMRDIKIIESTREEAFDLVGRDPHLSQPEHQKLKQVFLETMGDRLDLMDIL